LTAEERAAIRDVRDMWPSALALTKLGAAEEVRIAALVKRALS
jgi:hypothetical protein